MHSEHKILKWCAVVASLIVVIASCAVIFLFSSPDAASLTEEGPAITRVPEEMPAPPETEDLGNYKDGSKENVSVEENETEGELQKPVDVTVKVDGLEMHLLTAPVTVGEMLEAYDINVGKDDIVTPGLEKELTDDVVVKIERITYVEDVIVEKVPFKTKVEGTDKLPAGTQKVVQKGKKGEDEVTYRIKYSDGKEVSRKEVARKTITKPVTKIIEKSTVGTINGAEYSRKFTVKAYSYTGGGTTASGLPAAVGRIAVDPSVIPLGTRVYVEGYGFATAADTGGNIKGHTIDVYYNSHGQCVSWGCRYVTVYILK